MNIITCNHLTIRYDASFEALHDLNFHVEGGDYLCILGQNGAGKSTLIKALLQIKKPTKGSITYSDGLSARDIGYLPQAKPEQKDFPASVKEIVLSGCLNKMGNRPFYGIRERRLARENMEKMGISDLKNKCFRELSGGQKQRVLLARALCATSKILLLDEPTAGLDPVMKQELYDIITELNRRNGITIIMVSHDMNAALHDSRHILQLHQKQLFFGRTEDYVNSEVGQEFIRESERSGLSDLICPTSKEVRENA